MTISKFRIWSILPIIMTLIISGVLCIVLFSSILIWLIFGELRKKTILVKIDSNSITIKHFMGLGYSCQTMLKEFLNNFSM